MWIECLLVCTFVLHSMTLCVCLHAQLCDIHSCIRECVYTREGLCVYVRESSVKDAQ